MTVPSRVEAASLLLSVHPPPWFVRHACAVAEIASWLAVRVAERGIAVDRRLVEAAALLHDVDKLLASDDPAHRRPHGDGSADWLARLGHAELAPAVAAHPVTRLADEAFYPAWIAGAGPEERIVAYADKRAGQSLQSLDARFRSWARRYPAGWPGEVTGLARRRAERLEAEVCATAGITPDEVHRLPWTGSALRAARRRPAGAR